MSKTWRDRANALGWKLTPRKWRSDLSYKQQLAKRVCIRCGVAFTSKRPCYCDACFTSLSRETAAAMLQRSDAVENLLKSED